MTKEEVLELTNKLFQAIEGGRWLHDESDKPIFIRHTTEFRLKLLEEILDKLNEKEK